MSKMKRFGRMTIGGGSGGGTTETKTHLYKVIGGNTLLYTSENGIKKVEKKANEMELPKINSPGDPITLPDGTGWAVSVDDGSTVMIFNGYEALNNRDIYRSVVFAIDTIPVSGNDGSSYNAYLPLAGL